MNRLTEIVRAISATIHAVKPLLFELVLFLWAVVEMAKFMYHVSFGGHE